MLGQSQNQNQNLGAHETMELHELLTFKTVCAAKASAMKEFVSDPQLKALLDQDEKKAMQSIQSIQGVLSGAMNNMGAKGNLQ